MKVTKIGDGEHYGLVFHKKDASNSFMSVGMVSLEIDEYNIINQVKYMNNIYKYDNIEVFDVISNDEGMIIVSSDIFNKVPIIRYYVKHFNSIFIFFNKKEKLLEHDITEMKN